MKKIKIIVGNRPQFVKAAALFRSHAHDGQDSLLQLVHTGQHHDQNMSEIFFEEMDLPKPDWYLGIHGQTHGAMTGKMIESIESLLLEDPTDYVIVLGDTNSTLAGTIAACKLHIPVAHVEAGLRSFNRKMPEEINRVLTDHASGLLFTPTTRATDQLIAEGINRSHIHQVGDVMLDVFQYYRKKAHDRSNILQTHGLKEENYVLATVHREENTSSIQRFKNILEGLQSVADHIKVVLPLHPRTRKIAAEHNIDLAPKDNMQIIEPVGYFDMISLESHAKAIFTDSGGVQKEAFFCQTPCLTLRDETEWVELVEKGYNTLVPADSEAIYRSFLNLDTVAMDWGADLYGNGSASKKILDVTCSY